MTMAASTKCWKSPSGKGVLKGVLKSNHQLMQSYASMDPTLDYTNPYAPPDPMALTLGMPQ